MDFLPAPDVREWLLDQLRGLVERVGYEPLVCAPILLPTPVYFPDRWDADLESAHRMLSRFHRYYALDDVSPSLVVFEHERFSTIALGQTSEHHEGAAAYFAGIEDDRALYGVDAFQLDDPAGIAAAMAHEAAHTFRTRFGLTRAEDDVETEERLTDLTTVYLGAGALTTAATERHESRSEGLLDGHSWSVRRLGYLSPVEMAFALGAVLSARGSSRSEVRRVGEALGANQAKALSKAIEWLEERGDLVSRLGLPPPDEWEPPFDLEVLTSPLTVAEEPETLMDEPVDELPMERPHVVFAVAPGYGRNRFLVPGVIFTAASFVFGQMVGPILGPMIALVLGWLSLLAQRRYGTRRCSNSTCGAVIPTGSVICPGCGANVLGEIKGYDARLEALEKIEGLGGEA